MRNKINSAYRVQPISPVYQVSDKHQNLPRHQHDHKQQREKEPNYKKHAENTLYSNGSFSVLA